MIPERGVKDGWTALSLSTCSFESTGWELVGVGAEEFAVRPVEVEMPTWRCGQRGSI